MLSKARLAENYARFGRADKCFCPHEDTFPLAEVNDVSKEVRAATGSVCAAIHSRVAEPRYSTP